MCGESKLSFVSFASSAVHYNLYLSLSTRHREMSHQKQQLLQNAAKQQQQLANANVNGGSKKTANGLSSSAVVSLKTHTNSKQQRDVIIPCISLSLYLTPSLFLSFINTTTQSVRCAWRPSTWTTWASFPANASTRQANSQMYLCPYL